MTMKVSTQLLFFFNRNLEQYYSHSAWWDPNMHTASKFTITNKQKVVGQIEGEMDAFPEIDHATKMVWKRKREKKEKEKKEEQSKDEKEGWRNEEEWSKEEGEGLSESEEQGDEEDKEKKMLEELSEEGWWSHMNSQLYQPLYHGSATVC